MKLGAFSISLPVKNIHESYAFYEKLGFKSVMGECDQKWVIMQNDQTVIGLFEGIIPELVLTFNPGWNQNAKNIDPFEDVRVIQEKLKQKGIILIEEADNKTEGKAYISLRDPDGHLIMLDQHR